MGVVYKAVDEKLKRPVALKMLLAGAFANQRQLQRFQAEAEATARLQNPHIAQIYDVGECDRMPYLAMELVEGVSLAAHCARRPQSPRWSARVVECLSCAVEYAHTNGIVHRDLKPANILLAVQSTSDSVTDDVAPKIIDFGLAKIFGESSSAEGPSATRTGEVLGTPAYMAPEQVSSTAAHVGPAADIYALGAILYELLSGKPPFDGATPIQTLRLVVSIEPVPISRIVSFVPADLQTICFKCMEKEPHHRYRTAGDLADDLNRFLEHRSIIARRSGLVARLWRWGRRNPWLAVLTTLVLLLSFGMSIFVPFNLALQQSRDKAVALLARATRAERETKVRATLVNAANRRKNLRSGNLELMHHELTSLDLSNLDPALRNEVRDELSASLLQTAFVRSETIADVGRSLALDPTMSSLAIYLKSGEIVIRSRADKTVTGRIHEIGPLDDCELRFSDGGRFLAIYGSADDGRLWIFDRAANELVLDDPFRDILAFDLQESADRLVLGHTDGRITVHALSDPQLDKSIFKLAGRAASRTCRLSPDGRQLLVAYRQFVGRVDLIDLESGDLIHSYAMPISYSAAWSPDGRHIAMNTGGYIEIWNLAADRRVARWKAHDNLVSHLVFVAPDGDLLISGSWDGTIRLFNTWTGELYSVMWNVTLPAPSAVRREYIFHAIHGETAQLWRLRDGFCSQLPFRSFQRQIQPLCVAISQDSQMLALGTSQGVQVYDLPARRLLAELPGGGTSAISFSSSGRQLRVVEQGRIITWPYRTMVEADKSRLQLGPPRVVKVDTFQGALIQRDPDLLVLTSTDPTQRILMIDPDSGETRRQFGIAELGDGAVLASPTGRWVATYGWHSDTINIWDPERQERIARLRTETLSTCSVSPRGSRIATGHGDRIQLWNTRTWRTAGEVRKDLACLARTPTFSADGRLLAAHVAPDVLGIIEVSTQKVLARLMDPHAVDCALTFSPNGRSLVLVNGNNGTVHVWDLHAVRGYLREHALDWDESQPSTLVEIDGRMQNDVPIHSVDVDPGDLTTEIGEQERVVIHIATYRTLLRQSPKDEMYMHFLARALLLSSAEQDVSEAQSLIDRARKISPTNYLIRSTVALAQYRSHRWQEARRIVEDQLSHQSDNALAFDLLLLAVTCRQLEQLDQAKAYYDLAEQLGTDRLAQTPLDDESIAWLSAEWRRLNIQDK